MSENIHDKGYKGILGKKKNFLSLLKNFVHEPWISEIQEEDLELIDKEFISVNFKQKEADIIYKLSFKGKEVFFYCLLELQSSVDYSMPFRLLIYMTELWRRYYDDYDNKLKQRSSFRLPAIIPIILYNGQEEWTAVKSFKEYLSESEYFGNRVVDFEYIFLNVNKYDDETLKEVGNLISSIFLLDKSQEKESILNNLSFVFNLLVDMEEDGQTDFLNWVNHILFKKIGYVNEIDIENAIANFKKGSVEHMTYALERIFDKEREIGREEGREESMIQVAKEMLSLEEPLEKIAKLTKLPMDKIEKLQN